MNILSNQPAKGETYFGVKLFLGSKCLGSHDGVRLTKRTTYFVKSFFDMFIDELKGVASAQGVTLKVVTKTF